jgi:hypothetical protein
MTTTRNRTTARSRAIGAAGAASLVLAGSILAAGCGTGQALPKPTPHQPGPTNPCASAIKQLGGTSLTAAHAGGGSIELMTAARLTARVDVTPRVQGPACAILQPGTKVELTVGHSLVFVANGPPDLMGLLSAVRVTTSPGPSTSFGGLTTSHVIVTLTAVRSGTVNLHWVDCSGTGC